MLEAKKYSTQGEEIGKTKLPKSLFGVSSENAQSVLYEVVKMYQNNQRQGSSSVKSRSEVKGSGRKLFRQKGTGNARPGNIRTPLRVGGGSAFGPKVKDWYKPIPKKKKRLALKLALSIRAAEKQIAVIEPLKLDKPSSKFAKDLLDKITPEKSRTLVLIDGNDKALIKSFSNIPYVDMDKADGIYAYEILRCNFLLITEDALNKMKEVFAS